MPHGGKVANRRDFHRASGPRALRYLSVGEFVSRLWARFGAPDDVGFEGFHYHLFDRETSLVFSAYGAGSGPAYGARRTPGVRAVLETFERWIDATPPADCSIEYDTDFGRMRSGARGGEPFDEEATTPGRDPTRASTPAECAEIAATWIERDPKHGGWEPCLQRVLDDLDLVEGEVVHVSLAGGHVHATVDTGRQLIDVVLDADRFEGSRALWLRAYAAEARHR
jgi:hypothetical protein